MRWNLCVGLITLILILVACGSTMTASERDAIAPRVLDIPMDDCSLSPSRAYVLIVQNDKPSNEQYSIYSLATKQPISLPTSEQYVYGSPVDWMIGATHDILVVQPHWLVNLSTHIVTDTRTIDPLRTSPWWGTGPRFIDRTVSPDGRYQSAYGQVSVVPTHGNPLPPLIVSVQNSAAELCGNAWEADSSGLYFIDHGYQARATYPGPLRFLPITP